MTQIEILIDHISRNETKGFQAIMDRIEKHDHVSNFTLNATNVPWGLLEKHECTW